MVSGQWSVSKTMPRTEAVVVGRDELAGGRARLALHAPALAARARPGQLLALRATSSPFDPLLRTPVAIAGADGSAGILYVLFAGDGGASVQRVGDSVDLLGPIGRGWRVSEQAHNLLLLGAEADLGALLFLAAVATMRAGNVALLVGSAEGSPALPTLLVPAAVEYQLARGADPALAALDLLDTGLLSWADALYTTLPIRAYPMLAERIRAGRIQWQPGFAQGLLVPPMACFTGICDTCLVTEARRPWRACVDGPQCDVRDFVR